MSSGSYKKDAHKYDLRKTTVTVYKIPKPSVECLKVR